MKKILILILALISFKTIAQPIQADPDVIIGEDNTYADYWQLKAQSDRLDIFSTGIASPGIRFTDFSGTGNRILAVDADGDLVRTSVDPALTATPGGSTTQLQYNNAGAFGGISAATTDGTNTTFTSGALRATAPRFTTSLLDANGNIMLGLTATGSAVNYLQLANGAAGTRVSLTAAGSDADVDFGINSKGTDGTVILGSANKRTDWQIGGASSVAELQHVSNQGMQFATLRGINSAVGPYWQMGKSRTAGGSGSDIVSSGDDLGTISFAGTDGTDLAEAALIMAEVDGTPGNNDMPGRLVFSTTADGANTATERFRIDNAGNLIQGGVTTIVSSAGAATFTTVDTGQGANELYDMDQNVLTTSAPTFATVNTGQGANELFDMNQNVQTTDAVTFAQVTVDNIVVNANDITSLSGAINVTPLAGQDFVFTGSTTGDAIFNTDDLFVDTSTGRVGIGTASPGGPLHVVQNNAASGLTVGITTENTTTLGGGAVNHFVLDSRTWTAGVLNGSTESFQIKPDADLATATSNFEIESDGEVVIEASSSVALDVRASVSSVAANIINDGNNSGNQGLEIQCGEDSGTGTLIIFQDGDGTTTGSITFNALVTTYGSVSDRRLKTNIRKSSLSPALLRGQLRDYKWIEDGKEASGVIAQELYKVFPMAVHAPDSGMWSVDYGKLTIPLMATADNHEDRITALEKENAELKAMIAAIEKRLKALEKK